MFVSLHLLAASRRRTRGNQLKRDIAVTGACAVPCVINTTSFYIGYLQKIHASVARYWLFVLLKRGTAGFHCNSLEEKYILFLCTAVIKAELFIFLIIICLHIDSCLFHALPVFFCSSHFLRFSFLFLFSSLFTLPRMYIYFFLLHHQNALTILCKCFLNVVPSDGFLLGRRRIFWRSTDWEEISGECAVVCLNLRRTHTHQFKRVGSLLYVPPTCATYMCRPTQSPPPSHQAMHPYAAGTVWLARASAFFNCPPTENSSS